MHRRTLLTAGLCLAATPAVFAAQDVPPAPAPAVAEVDCGPMTCFSFRVALGPKSADTRASEAMDTINKYLGGKVGKVTTQVVGKNIKLLLNGEQVALITPADAAAEKEKSVAALAARWRKKLELAFEATKAQV
jgi:hypothetical protein